MVVYLTFKGLCRGSLSTWQSRPLRYSKPSSPSFILEKHVGFEASSCDDRIDVKIPFNTDVYQILKNIFIPISLKYREKEAICPGYHSKLTRSVSPHHDGEAKDSFVVDPESFLPQKTPLLLLDRV